LLFHDTINQPCAGSEETAEYKRKMFKKTRRSQSLCQELVMSKNDENIDMTDPKEGEIRVKRTSSNKEKSNKANVSQKLISDDMDSSNINNYTPSTRSTRFPDRGPSEEYSKKEVKITLKDYILRRQKKNAQE
jgi:hypothetical protein